MDTFDNLKSMLIKVFGYGISFSKNSDGKSANFKIYGATTKLGQSVNREVTVDEKQASQLFDILSKGCLIKQFINEGNLQICVSDYSSDIVSFVMDGKELSNSEVNELYEKAKSELKEKITQVYDEVNNLKNEMRGLVDKYKYLDASIESNKERIEKVLESDNVRKEIQNIFFSYTIPRSQNQQENADIKDFINGAKKDMSPQNDYKTIVELVNKIASSEYSLFFMNEPFFIDWITVKGTNDIVIFYSFLQTFKDKIEEAISKMKGVIKEQSEELEKLKSAIDSIKTIPFSQKSNVEAVKEVVNNNNVDLDKKIETPQLDTNLDSQRPEMYSGIKLIDSFGYDESLVASQVARVNESQNRMINNDEKIALNLYKSQLYRAFNEIIRYQKQHNMPIEKLNINDDIESIIKTAYDEMFKKYNGNKNSAMYRLMSMKSNSNKTLADSFFSRYHDSMPTYEQYRDLVIRYYEPLLNSLSKNVLDEDLVVYRGVSGDQLDLTGIISTSLDPKLAESMGGRISDSNRQVFIRMKLPKGSPVVIYTDDLMHDTVKHDGGFNEDQKELAFNSDLFEITSCNETVDTKKDSNGNTITVLYYDVTLQPKTKVLNQEELGTVRS